MSAATRVTACFFGDGAVAEGEFHESLNLAALWKLPVLFLCENNLYAMGTAHRRAGLAQTDLVAKPAATASRGDSRRHGRLAVEKAAASRGRPRSAGAWSVLARIATYRFRAHSMFDAELYRTKAEVEAWKERDPIRRSLATSGRRRTCSTRRRSSRRRGGRAEVDARGRVRRSGQWEPVEDLRATSTSPAGQSDQEATAMTSTHRYREARPRSALREALQREPRASS